MHRIAAAVLALAALPALATQGFFPERDRGEPEALKLLQCTPGQSMVCEVRCPAPSDGRMPVAAACTVVSCACDDVPAKVDVHAGAPTALVTFDLRKLLGLPLPK